jgi:iron complex transport system substrate-binding protein
VAVVFAAISSGCGTSAFVEVEENPGGRAELRSPARRIISTVPSNTEILYALGLADRVVGVTKYCAKTCDTRGKVVIGGWVTPDYAKIRSLAPDLIFAFGGLQKRHLAEFREIAPTFLIEPITVAETLDAVLAIGRLTGRAGRAEQIVAEQRAVLARVESVTASIPPGKRLRVARVFGAGRKVRTMGRRSFLSDVIRLAGGVNAFGDADAGYFHVDFERLAAVDPDVLLVHGEEPAKVRAAFRKSPDFSNLRAVREGRVLVRSCDYICHPNATIGETVVMLARDLYPRLFPRAGGSSQ